MRVRRGRELADRYGTPLYVYDAEAVRTAFRTFRSLFSYDPVEFHYAVVCNKNPYLVRALAAEGCGVHANTPGDAEAALRAGVAAAEIVYSGTNLDAADLDYLVARGIRMNLDATDQIDALAARGFSGEIGLRLLVDPQRPHRIGIDPAEIPQARARAARAGIRIAGLHMYAGTNTLRAERFLACLDRTIKASVALGDLAYLDLGGGFGIEYDDDDAPLDLARLGREASDRMAALSARRGRRIALWIEPGRILVGRAGALLTRVVSVKERGGRRFVGVDTTVGNIVAESVYHPRHRIFVPDVDAPTLGIPTDVCGNTTHTRDFLGRDLRLPALAPGDLLALGDVGAYGYAMSSHFLNRPRPAEVVLDGAEEILTTRRETFDDLMATIEPLRA